IVQELYVNQSVGDVAEVPLGVVSVTFTVPAAPAGLVAVICVPAELTTTFVAGVVPKSTAVAPVKPAPVIVSVVPPAKGPSVGLMPVTVGADTLLKTKFA